MKIVGEKLKKVENKPLSARDGIGIDTMYLLFLPGNLFERVAVKGPRI